MRQKQYLITEAELRAIVAQAQNPDLKVDIEVFDYEMDETSLDIFLVDPKTDVCTPEFSFSEGRPTRARKAAQADIPEGQYLDNTPRPRTVISFPTSPNDNFPI